MIAQDFRGGRQNRGQPGGRHDGRGGQPGQGGGQRPHGHGQPQHGGGRGQGRGPRGGGQGGGRQGGGRGRDRFRGGRAPRKGGGPRFRTEIAEEQEQLAVPPLKEGVLRIYSLGGLEDVGERNMQVLEYGNDIITIDCGLWFAEPDLMPGIDYVVPNSKHLQANATKIRGMVMCHGHMDHIGGISHVAPLLGFPPIYCTGLTKAFIERRQEEFGNLGKFKINEFKPRDVLQLGAFRIEPFHINHNIPEAVGLAIHTPVGTIVHTGDFKFDLSPTMGAPADVAHIAQIGDRGVVAMMSDSTDAHMAGHQISETDVEKSLDGLVKNVEGRLIAVTFASLLMRIQMLINLAEKYGRKVVLEGRSMKTNVEIAHQRKLLRVKPGTILDERRINDVPDNKLLVIGTGAQAEEFAMLMRVVNKEHARIQIKPGDTVLFSSSVIPGHERNVDALKDTLHRQGRSGALRHDGRARRWPRQERRPQADAALG
ncbi:MAG: ribonuclease J [Candidatus Andersenbacteria bacterium]